MYVFCNCNVVIKKVETLKKKETLCVFRDFVNLRRWEKRGDVYVSCNVAVECEEMPPKREHIR